jgi:hypothetical protein
MEYILFVWRHQRQQFLKEFKGFNMWEATDALPCVEPLTVKGTGLLAPVKQVLQTSPQLTQEAVDRAISMYLQGFETWSSLLTAP